MWSLKNVFEGEFVMRRFSATNKRRFPYWKGQTCLGKYWIFSFFGISIRLQSINIKLKRMKRNLLGDFKWIIFIERWIDKSSIRWNHHSWKICINLICFFHTYSNLIRVFLWCFFLLILNPKEDNEQRQKVCNKKSKRLKERKQINPN